MLSLFNFCVIDQQVGRRLSGRRELRLRPQPGGAAGVEGEERLPAKEAGQSPGGHAHHAR